MLLIHSRGLPLAVGAQAPCRFGATWPNVSIWMPILPSRECHAPEAAAAVAAASDEACRYVAGLFATA